MFKFEIILLFFGALVRVQAQTLSPELIASAGAHAVNTSTQLSWSLGEPLIETVSGSALQLTQGFHQTYFTTTALDDPAPGFLLRVYPNPTAGQLNIETVLAPRPFSLALYDQLGRALQWQGSQQGTSLRVLDLSGYTPGLYLLQLCGEEGKTIQSFKIIINN